MADKKNESKQPKVQSNPTQPADHLAAGAADLRARAKACRSTGGRVKACRRLEAAAQLLEPEVEPGEPAAPSVAASAAPRAVAEPRRPSSLRRRRRVLEEEVEPLHLDDGGAEDGRDEDVGGEER